MSNRLLTLFFFLLLGPLSISYAEDTNDNNVVIIGLKSD
ncbi:Uncharacterised protein [Providencia rustigianii]|nr:Uncharacterised protein [Providencia rustigianii]